MASQILKARRLSGEIADLADATRGEKGLTCYVCGGRLKVCDGQGAVREG